jgi:hypothetical protein
MDNNLELLILLLKYIESDTSIQVENKFYTYNRHPLVNAAKYMANEYLIGDDGHPIRQAIDYVSTNGFYIYPGEMDSFGWLTACIELSRGIIMFG